jgi:hypothetical protein
LSSATLATSWVERCLDPVPGNGAPNRFGSCRRA